MESKMYEDSWGKVWKNSNGSLHRENDLPAYEDNNGTKAWIINGTYHRELGPALIWYDGEEEWYLNDIYYKPENMPMKLFMIYCNWEYRKKNGI